MTYASGEFYPSPIGGAIGLVGGMTLLIIVSALAAGASVALLPNFGSRVAFMTGGWFWLLLPGVDALGVLLIGLLARTRRRIFWFATLPVHAVAGIAAIGLVLRARVPILWGLIGIGAIMVGFTIDGEVRNLDVDVTATEHLLYTTRYLLPILWLGVAR